MTDGELEFFQHTFHHFGGRLGRLQCSIDELLSSQHAFNHTLQEIKRIMSTNAVTQEQFTADLGKLKSDVATLITTVTDGVAALKAQIAALQAANPAVDFSALDATVNQVDTDVAAATASLQPPAPTA
jgi:hypothetical protein